MELKDLLISMKKRREKFFKNPLFYALKIKSRAKELYGEKVQIFLFGSIVKGNWTYSSDIDLLAVVPEIQSKEKSNVVMQLTQDIESPSPFQIILCNTVQFENWFKKHLLDQYIEV